MKTFTEKVLAIVAAIPRGQTMTYKQVAEKAGSSRAARAVGSIMAKNQNLDIPCHRVVCSNGSVGSYNGLRGDSKKDLLLNEAAL